MTPVWEVHFLSARNAFEEIVRCYGINFRSAADLGCGTGLFAFYVSRCWNVPVFAMELE
jgi:predicted RNA methylase